MPSGTPDFGRAAAAASTHKVADLAEQAGRTGSIVTFHRGGELLWLDGFEAGVLKWDASTSGAGGSVALSTVAARNGAQSVLLTAGSDVSLNALIFRQQGLPSGDQIGIEWSLFTGNLPASARLQTFFYDGTNALEFRVLIDYVNDRIDVRNSSGSLETVLSDLDWFGSVFTPHTLKLIVNQSTGRYVRLFFDHRSVDLSAISGETLSSSVLNQLHSIVRCNGTSGQNDELYLDDFILTQNEP